MPFKHTFPNNLLDDIGELLNQASMGISITDPNQKDNPMIYANDYFYNMLGYSPDEVIGKNCRFLQGAERDQEAVHDIREAIKEGRAVSRVLKNFKKDGSVIYNQLTISPIYDQENRLKLFLGVQKDVTQLHFSLEQVKATESLANIGYWELDLRANHLHWSDKIYNLFEIDKENFGATYEAFLEMIHPQDRQAVNDAYTNSLQTQEKYAIQHRLLMKDGRVKYVEEKCESYFDKDANALRSVGTVQDISYLKTVELELYNTISFLESYKLSIDESSIVSKTDKNGVITYVNDNFCKISGYDKSEVIGKAHSIIRHPDTKESVFLDLWKTIKAKKVWKKVIKNRDKFGNAYWVNTTILPILDKNDAIVEFIAVRHDVTQMLEQQEQLSYIANNDILTGLGNRYKLLNDIRESHSPALAMINIDNFSHINDFYGHEVGDRAIKEFGKKLSDHRDSLSCNLYHICGDEFVVLYKSISRELFLKRIDDLEKKLSNAEISLIGDEFALFNFSIGVSFEAKEKILATADMALKIAKKSNKGLVIYEDAISLNKEYQNNLKWKKIIKKAIESDAVVPVFQPIVNNQSLAWEKYESLVRLEEEERLVSPFFFLEISKKTRHYSQISYTMIEKSFKAFQNKTCEFSLNLTIEDILNEEITEYLFRTLDHYGIGERVVFEIVESESIENFETVMAFIAEVKKYGCKIAIDDFGTGYSNFVYLVRLNPDYIKIDGSLIKDICTNATTELVVKNIVRFAKDLGMKTIAEFVENEAIFERVRKLGIDYSQGYYFSKPKRELL